MMQGNLCERMGGAIPAQHLLYRRILLFDGGAKPNGLGCDMNDQRARFQRVASELEIASDFSMFARMLTPGQRAELLETLSNMARGDVEDEVPGLLASIPADKLPATVLDCTLRLVKNLVDVYYQGAHRVYMTMALRDHLLRDFDAREDQLVFAELVSRIPMVEVRRGPVNQVAHDLVLKYYDGPRGYHMSLLMREALHALWKE